MIDRENFDRKNRLLENARVNLKKQFHGLDDIVDRILNTLSGWYCFPEMQEKPLVINLWGMTGYGKTSLVKAIIRELNLSKRSFIYDNRLNNKRRGEENISSILQFIHDHFNDDQYILLIDEFQNGRTIRKDGDDDQANTEAELWELLDTGKLMASLKSSEVYSLSELLMEVLRRLRMNQSFTNEHVELKLGKGPRSSGRRTARKKYDLEGFDVLEYYKDDVFRCNKDQFETDIDAYKFMKYLDPQLLPQFIRDSIEKALEPKEVNGTRGLIFIAGNLDEAYREVAEFDHEMDPDVLAEQSQRINLQTIKKSLGYRFRKEQISRLGNHHMIYPAFKSHVFRAMIKDMVARSKEKFLHLTGISLQVEESLEQKIYEEGVVPAQGMRPVIAAVQLWINSQFSHLVSFIFTNDLSVESILLEVNSEKLVARYYSENHELSSQVIEVFSDQDNSRKNLNIEERYLVAVHEAGHAIGSMALLNQVPKKATSLSTATDKGGFVLLKHPRRYYKQDILSWIATNIAGGAAERLIFGEDHVPVGASSDHYEATSYIVDLIKSGAIGEVPGFYANRSLLTNDVLYDDDNVLTELASKWLKESKELIIQTLQEHEFAVVRLADILLKNDYLSKEQLQEFADQYFPGITVETSESKGVYAKQFHEKLDRH